MKTFESQKNKEFIDEEKRYFHIVKSIDLSKIADAGTKEVAKKMLDAIHCLKALRQDHE